MENFSSRPEVQLRAMKRLLTMPEDQLGRSPALLLFPGCPWGQTLEMGTPLTPSSLCLLGDLFIFPEGSLAFSACLDSRQAGVLPDVSSAEQAGWGGMASLAWFFS
jgi:hypothetical protein